MKKGKHHTKESNEKNRLAHLGKGGESQRHNKEIFIKNSKNVHDNKYNYDEVVYKNTDIKVCIKCSIHGEFWQTPYHHTKRKHGCPICGKEKSRLKTIERNKAKLYKKPITTTEEFIEKAKKIHDDKYDYSKVEYKGIHIKVCIICPSHGEFWQTASNHYQGHSCPKCNGGIKSSTEEFIEKANLIHENKYDYSKSNYIDSNTKVCIICLEHGEFWQTPDNHLQKKGCPRCSKNIQLTTKEFIEKAKLVHGGKYDYSKVEYITTKDKITIICEKHDEFLQRPNNHLNGAGCPICNESKGEKEIREYLIKNNIQFERQKTFEKCKNINYLPFDFYLLEYNLLIEYDGIQHFKLKEYFGGEEGFEYIKTNDKIKNDYCKNNNINLLRISYVENIENVLNDNIF